MCAGPSEALALGGEALAGLSALRSLRSLDLHIDKAGVSDISLVCIISRIRSCGCMDRAALAAMQPSCRTASTYSPASCHSAPMLRPLRPRHPRPQLEGSTRELGCALSGLTRLALRCRLESVALAPEFLEGLSQVGRLARPAHAC